MTDAQLNQQPNPKQPQSKSDKEDIKILIKSFPGCKPCDMAENDAKSGDWDPDDNFNLDVEKKDADDITLAPEIHLESKCFTKIVTGYLSAEAMREHLKDVSCGHNPIEKKFADGDEDG